MIAQLGVLLFSKFIGVCIDARMPNTLEKKRHLGIDKSIEDQILRIHLGKIHHALTLHFDVY